MKTSATTMDENDNDDHENDNHDDKISNNDDGSKD